MPDAQMPPVEARIQDSAENVEKKLSAYLKNRQRLERKFESPNQANRVIFLQPWIRDSSLRYFMIKTGDRIRHLSEWKAQWTLEPRGNHSTYISLDVLEVIHLGPPSNKRRPNPEEISAGAAQSDWIETTPDRIRAAVELRRFWTENYLGTPLPPVLAQLTVKDLGEPPLGSQIIERENKKRLKRIVTY